MLDDITIITKVILDQFVTENKVLKSQKSVYDVYRQLERVVDKTKLVSRHYLALDFEEEFLKNSSYREPSDKWRYFFNKDLESLNESLKEYLHKLSLLSLEDDDSSGFFTSFMSNLYNCKVSYAFIRDEYNIGFVEPCGFMMISNILNTDFNIEKYHISEFIKTDLSMLEQRVSLKNNLEDKIIILEENLKCLREYILLNISMDQLL